MNSTRRALATLPLLTISSLALCGATPASADLLPLPLPTLSAPALPTGPLPLPLPGLAAPAPTPAPTSDPTSAPVTAPVTGPTGGTSSSGKTRPVVAPRPASTTVTAAAVHRPARPVSSAQLSGASLMDPPAQQLSAAQAPAPAFAPLAPAPVQVVPQPTPAAPTAQASAVTPDAGLPGTLVVLAALLAVSAGTVNVAVRRTS